MECEFCGKKFSSKTNLLRHQRTVASCLKIQGKKIPVEFSCEYCNKTFPEKSNLGRHYLSCKVKKDIDDRQNIERIKRKYDKKITKFQNIHKNELEGKDDRIIKLEQKIAKLQNIHKNELEGKNDRIIKLEQKIKEKDEEIVNLKIKCESSKSDGKVEVYDKVCTKMMDKSTVTNNTMNVHPKLVNLPITNIHPLTEDYVKEQVSNGGYTFDHYLKGETGLVDFIYSITMSENQDGDIERNYVCTDPTRDSYHRLVETKEWEKDKGGKFVDVILDTISDKADGYHMKLLDERTSQKRDSKLGYDPDYIYKANNDMHSGIIRQKGKERRNLRQKIKKETSRKITV